MLWGDSLFEKDLRPYMPEKYKKGFMARILHSVTVEIHRQIGALKKQKLKPARIYLCPVCSVRFCYEHNHGVPDMRKAPKEYLGMPIVYRYKKIVGVWVEPEKPNEPG